MATRMEQAIERIALSVLQNVSVIVEPPISMEKLKRNFYARWPIEGSRFPMNDAMRAAQYAAIVSKERTSSAWDEEGTLKAPITDVWDEVVAEAIAQYFDEVHAETVAQYFGKAQENFDRGTPLEGTEALTDAVRVALGYIAATREWPHGTRGELYNVAEGLAAGAVPKEDDNAFEYPDTVTEEGAELCSFFAASMGGPDSVKFGLFYDSQDGSDEDAIRFAERTIELAGRLAKKKAVIP